MVLTSSERLIFWLLFLIAAGIFLHRIAFIYRTIKMGRRKRNEGFENPGERIKTLLSYVLGQRCNTKNVTWRDLAGLGHMIIFWGVVLFTVYYFVFLFIGDGFGIDGAIRKLAVTPYFVYLMEIVAIFILIAMSFAAGRRALIRPARLGPDFEIPTFLLITLSIYVLLICNFALDGCRLNLDGNAFRTPVAAVFSAIFDRLSPGPDQLRKLYHVVWWVRSVVFLGFFVYIPYSHHQHPLFCPISIFFRSFRPSGAMAPVSLGEERLGASGVKDLSWKDLLESYACTQCGRCQDSCPVYLTGKPFSPKLLLVGINEHLKEVARRKGGGQGEDAGILGRARGLTSDGILSCTTCGACIEICPVFNRSMDINIEIRRDLVYQGRFDPGHKLVLQRTFNYGNPHGLPPANRDNIPNIILGVERALESEKYDVLYWLGCSVYFDERSQDIARAVVRILKKSALRVAVLGSKEQCCGDFVRRIGDEGLFQRLARSNAGGIGKFRFDTLITHCPHCFNTFKNEYPNYGGHFKVMHHSEFILGLLETGGIRVHKAEGEVVFHDPCYLGRHNQVYDPPRKVVQAVSDKLVEFPLSRNKSFCCGAGGGHMWKHEELGTRINEMRIDQALYGKVKTVVTACPFCLLMLEDALLIKGRADDVKVKDLAELVSYSLS